MAVIPSYSTQPDVKRWVSEDIVSALTDYHQALKRYQQFPKSTGAGQQTPRHRSHAISRKMSQRDLSSSEMDGPQTSAMVWKDRQDSNMVLKRSYSTPSVKTTALSTMSEFNPQSEKKRNKLGYHRTSIACSHCRRRKIRCIVSPEVQNRCINCIRLKKECSFHPVEQQLSGDSRNIGATTHNTSGPVLASQTLPSTHIDRMPDMLLRRDSQQLLPTVKKVPSHSRSIPTLASSENAIFSTGSSADALNMDKYNPASSSTMKWPPPGSNNADLNLVWQSMAPESPMPNDAYSSYALGPPTISQWQSGNSDSGSQGDWSWSNFPPATRSMSFSGELLTHHQNMIPVTVAGQSFDQPAPRFQDPFSSRLGSSISGYPPTANAFPIADLSQQTNSMHWETQAANSYSKQKVDLDNWQYQGGGGGAGPAAGNDVV